MSKESYQKGFVKAAESMGVKPSALAKFAMSKMAADGDKGIWDSLKEWLSKQDDTTKKLLGAGGGALIGGTLGGLLGGKGWGIGGALLGGLGGYGLLDQINTTPSSSTQAAAAAKSKADKHRLTAQEVKDSNVSFQEALARRRAEGAAAARNRTYR